MEIEVKRRVILKYEYQYVSAISGVGFLSAIWTVRLCRFSLKKANAVAL
jgi:hypothetical protein